MIRRKPCSKTPTVFPYPDVVSSWTAISVDINGYSRPREYQLIASAPGSQHSCQTGVCSIRMGPEDDGQSTLRDLAGASYLTKVFGDPNDTSYNSFRKQTPYLRPARFGVLSDLTRSAWEPDSFGSISDVSCLTVEMPCTRFVVSTVRSGLPVTFIHSDKAAPSGSRFERPFAVYPGSLISAALKSKDQSPWVLNILDRMTSVEVLDAEPDSFLLKVPDDPAKDSTGRSGVTIYTPNQGLGRLVSMEAISPATVSGADSGISPPAKTMGNAALRQVHALLKQREVATLKLPAVLTFGGNRSGYVVIYRETGGNGSALFVVITGNSKEVCSRHATTIDIYKNWSEWHNAKNGQEAPKPNTDYDANTATLKRLLLEPKLSWRKEGFARNPLLLLLPEQTTESTCVE